MIRSLSLALVVAAGIPSSIARAQVTVADEGSFTITVKGERVGRENFWIRTTPDPRGPVYIATATSIVGGRKMEPRELADPNGVPLGYDLKISGDDVLQLSGRIERGRMGLSVRTPRGESKREFLVSDNAVLIDDDVYHQYFFLARRKASGSVPIVIPQRNAQVMARVTQGEHEPLTIGGATVDARRLVVSEGGVTRDIWVDASGRVLKVAISSRGVVALRDDPPR